MSGFYLIATRIFNKIQINLRRSLLFSIFFSILSFIENQWINSYFVNLYPSGDFSSFFKRSKIIFSYLFSPPIVIFVFAIFLLLSLSNLHFSLIVNLAIAFMSFLIGALVFPRLFLNNTNNTKINSNNLNNNNSNSSNSNTNNYNSSNSNTNNYNSSNSNTNNYNSNNLNGDKENDDNKSSIKKNFLLFKMSDVYSLGFCLFIIGVIFFFLSIASVGGLPILSPSLRYSLKPILTMPIFLIVPAIALIFSSYLEDYKNGKLDIKQIRFRFLILIAISALILIVLGYRTPVLAILLVMIIMAYYGRVLAIWEIILGVLLSVGLLIGIGYIRALGEFAISSNTSPFASLQSRADFTLHVLNLLNLISGDFGLLHGYLTLSSIPGSDYSPRMLIGQLIAWRTEVSVTPTLIGPMLVDFGRFGLVIGMGVLGFILGIGHKIVSLTKDNFYIALYAILLSYTILGVETGILDITILMYFVLGAIIYILNIFKNKKVNNW